MATYEERRLDEQYKRRMFLLKCASGMFGLFGMFFVWSELHCQMSGPIAGHIQLQNHPELYHDTEQISEKLGLFDKYHVWLAGVAAVLITLAFLFSLTAICCMFTRNYKFDAYSRLGAAITLAVAAIFLLVYVANVYQASCGENGYVTRKNKAVEAMNNNNTDKDGVKWTLYYCPAAVFLSSPSVSIRSITEPVGNKDNGPETVGFHAIAFVIVALLAVCYGVVCLTIFLRATRQEKLHAETRRINAGNVAVSVASMNSRDSGL